MIEIIYDDKMRYQQYLFVVSTGVSKKVGLKSLQSYPNPIFTDCLLLCLELEQSFFLHQEILEKLLDVLHVSFCTIFWLN